MFSGLLTCGSLLGLGGFDGQIHLADVRVENPVHTLRRHEARGRISIVRYADDFVMGFQHRTDASRMMRALKERLARFGLALHENKTRHNGLDGRGFSHVSFPPKSVLVSEADYYIKAPKGDGRVAQPFGFRPHRSERAAFPHSAPPEGNPKSDKARQSGQSEVRYW